ncbi:MAG: PAS domain S-box protein [Bacteroidia bacterium]|nr:MAG: PAS domain S-box protein [Bacteroidia bacterium]
MNKREQKPPFPWTSFGVLIFVALLLLTIVIIYTSGEKKSLIANASNEIEAVAKLKSDQIQRWRREKINDANLIYENRTLVEQIETFFVSDDNGREKLRLEQYLNSLLQNYDFGSVLLVDAGGFPGLSIPAADSAMGPNLRNRITSIIANPRIELSDMHQAEVADYPHLDLVIPMRMPHEGDTVLSGVIILRIDPERELFPLLESWPTPSSTSECVLLSREGDSVKFISRLRHIDNIPLQKTLPLSDELVPAALAARGYEGVLTGMDYRGKEVVAANRAIPESDWYLVAKTDMSEVLSQYNREITMLWLTMLFTLIALGIIGLLVIRSTRLQFIRKKYKEELDRQAIMKHLDFVMKHGNDIILLIDTDLYVVEANDRALEAYGYPREKLLGMNISDLRTSDEVSFLPIHVKDLKEKGSSYIETVHKRRDGTAFPIELSARTGKGEGIVYVQTIGRDISERKRAEEEMRESNKKLNTIINNLRGVVFRCLNDSEWTMKYISDGIYELTGYLPNEFIDNKIRSFNSIVDPEDQDRVGVEIHKALSTGYLYTIEYRVLTSSGNRRWVWERGRGYYEGDKLVALEGFISDITDRKRIEEELIRARDKAEQSDRLKTAFLHNISHEIRTPMNAIVGFTTLLDSPDNTDESRRQYIDIIYQSSNQLLSIITDIVDISNIETGLVKVTLTEVNLNVLIRNLYDQYRLRVSNQNLAFSCTAHLADSDAVVMTDETKVIQIFANLLNNALKFTREGRIEFGYVLRGETIEFFVSDTGIGIAPENHEKVFERFFQVESPNSKQYSGTGLGLAISKAYVELLGGAIWIIAAPGEGSLFCFSIPFSKKSAQQLSAKARRKIKES